VDPHRMRLERTDGSGWREVTARHIVLAVGTVTTRDAHIPFDGEHVFTSDDILTMQQLPRTLAVVGAGVIGIEYATIFAALGVRVTVVDKHPAVLPFVDREIIETLVHVFRENRGTLRLGAEVKELCCVTAE